MKFVRNSRTGRRELLVASQRGEVLDKKRATSLVQDKSPLLLDFAFRKLGALDFRYGYERDNTKSCKLAASFGFRYDKTYELTRPWDGRVMEIESCLLTREDYLARKE